MILIQESNYSEPGKLIHIPSKMKWVLRVPLKLIPSWSRQVGSAFSALSKSL